MNRITASSAAIAAALALAFSGLVATPAAAAVQAVLIASPGGSGSTCSVAAPCSLTGARDKVRTMTATQTGDLEVQLRGGTYALSSPFVLTDADSGRNGHRVVYRAYPGESPVLSGGQNITGWTVHDAGLGIYRAPVPASFEARQLYVDGMRAVRARGATEPSGYVHVPATGYTAPTSAMASWGNVADVEIVDFNEWIAFRCGVASASGTSVTMDSACWANAHRHGTPSAPGVQMNGVTWVENAYELLDQAGEWYLDRAADYVYYIPRSGENLSTATVTAGVTESLLELAGTSSTPIQNVTVTGITLAYSAWSRPSSTEGYPALQAGFQYETRTVGTANTEAFDLLKTPAAVTVTGGHGILIERNTFTHLGGAALNLETGTQNTTVRGNVFTDISSSGIQVGHITLHHASAAETLTDNEISNNYIHRVATEYQDGVGIWVGYTDGTRVLHNELVDLPYSGISAGWGWGCVDAGYPCGYTTPSVARDNEIAYNHIQNVMLTLKDGGGIYTLGAQPNSTVHHNFVTGMPKPYGALYLDQKTSGVTWSDNVVSNAYWWLHNNSQLAGPPVSGNYATTNLAPSGAVVAGNSVDLTAWPAAARATIDGAGLEPSFAGIRPTGAPTGDLARGKTTTTSSTLNSGTGAANVVDGNASTLWSPVAPASDPRPWVQVDLGSRFQINQVELVTRQGSTDQPPVRADFEIWVSNDPTFATYTVLGAQGSTPVAHQSTWTGVTSMAVSTGHRYVRAIKSVDGYFTVADLRVFGTASVSAANVSQGKSTTASSTYDSASGSANAVDGSIYTGWSPLAPASDARPWVQVDLGSKHYVTRVEFTTRQGSTDYPVTRENFAVQASNDPTFSTFVTLGSHTTPPLDHTSTWVIDGGALDGYRYVRLAKTADGYFYVGELRVMGVPVSSGSIATAKPSTSSTVFDSGSGSEMAFDGQTSTGWSPVAPATDPRPWVQVDLGGAYRLSTVELVTRQGSYNWPETRQNFEIRASNDPTFATFTVLATQGATPLAHQSTLTASVSSTTAFRYIRAIKTVDEYFFVAELRAIP